MDNYEVITQTSELVSWFVIDQMDETFESVINGGAIELQSYADEFYSGELSAVDWCAAHKVLSNWNAGELWRYIVYDTVESYLNANI